MATNPESARKQSYRMEMKVASEYLAAKFDEIIKKHTTNPSPILDISQPEQRESPPKPEKLEKPKEILPKTTQKPRKCPNTVPKKRTDNPPQQRLKSNTILSKTININKQNLNITVVSVRQKKAKSQQKPFQATNHNDLNPENLKKLDSQTLRNQQFETSSLIVNPSETQSLLEDKNLINGVIEHGNNPDKSIFSSKAKKSTDKTKENRSKSANNQKNIEEDPEKKKQEVIMEEPHLEESHLEPDPEEKKKDDSEDLVRNLMNCEKEMNEKSEPLNEEFFEKIKAIKNPNQYMKKILIAFLGLFAGSHENFPLEILRKTEFKFEEIVQIISKSNEVTQSVRNFKNSLENKLITDKNIFYALETLTKSYIALDNIDSCEFIDEISKLSLFLQKTIEYYKVYNNFLTSEKIKKLNIIENDEQDHLREGPSRDPSGGPLVGPLGGLSEGGTARGGTTEGTLNGPLNGHLEEKKDEKSPENNNNEKDEQKKKCEVESKVKQFINNNGVKDKKVDDLTKMKREIQEIKDQNSRLQWEIERDRKRMERLNDLQNIQKDLNENFEMEKKFKEYMKEKEKNERTYVNSIKKDTIEIMKMRKELENQNKKETEKEIQFENVNEKKWRQKQEEEKKREKSNEVKQKIIILQENREIKKKKAEEEKEIKHKEISEKSPQRTFEKQFKELLKKKNELKKEYESNLSYLPSASGHHNGTNNVDKSQAKKEKE